MGGVQRNVRKEWRIGILLLFDPVQCRLKEHVRTIAFGLDDRIIVQQHVVKIDVGFVGGEITQANLANSTSPVHQYLVESSTLWQVRLLVTKVPFAKQSCCVAR